MSVEVVLGRSRVAAVVDRPTGRPPDAIAGPDPDPDPDSWPAALAAAAARDRWAGRHRSVLVVQELRSEDPTSGAAMVDALDRAGRAAAETGTRRIDLRIAAGHPLLAWLAASGWIIGPLDAAGQATTSIPEVVASRSFGYPWAVPARPLPAWAARLPGGARRIIRRARDLDPDAIPSLARVAGAEVLGSIRQRRVPPPPESVPRGEAPAGAHPFAPSRFATIDEALERVAPALRGTTLIDLGCGDGRVLRHALDRGLERVLGRELDPELAERAQAVAPEASIEVGDALASPLPDDVGIVFLNNPFDASLVPRVASLVTDALATRPRPLVVLYLNPPTIEPFLAAGLVPVDVTPQLTVLVPARP